MLFRYVPIVMPPELLERYPARSKTRIKQRTYDCAPQLSYAVFLHDDFAGQVREYVRGLAVEVPQLLKFGASAAQVEEFRDILASIADEVSASSHS
jgi:hypothetical protein